MTTTSVKIQPTVTEAPKTEAAPKPAKQATYSEQAKIKLLQPTNPKRGASAKRYACYRDGMTVKEYLDACEKVQPDEPRHRWRADLAWDMKRKYIEVA